MDRRVELRKEMMNAYGETIRFINDNNINKIEDESVELQEEFERLQKIVYKKQKEWSDEMKKLGKTRIIELN